LLIVVRAPEEHADEHIPGPFYSPSPPLDPALLPQGTNGRSVLSDREALGRGPKPPSGVGRDRPLPSRWRPAGL